MSNSVDEIYLTYSDDVSAEENAACALFGIARALLDVAASNREIATQIKYLGTGNAGTEMGAIECLAVKVDEGLTRVATYIGEALEGLGARYDAIPVGDADGADPIGLRR
jgi:hypothetical protein